MSETSIKLLSDGLLNQFSSLQEIEQMLTQLLEKQNQILEKDIKELDFYQDEQLQEISLMVNISSNNSMGDLNVKFKGNYILYVIMYFL